MPKSALRPSGYGRYGAPFHVEHKPVDVATIINAIVLTTFVIAIVAIGAVFGGAWWIGLVRL